MAYAIFASAPPTNVEEVAVQPPPIETSVPLEVASSDVCGIDGKPQLPTLQVMNVDADGGDECQGGKHKGNLSNSEQPQTC
eukprot:4698465-Amphidinium_carterae.1